MGISLLIAGLSLIALVWLHHLRLRVRSKRSEAWPSTAGVVTASQVIRKLETSADNDLQEVYHPRLSYRYEVGDQVLTGERVRFGAEPRFSNRHKAEAALADYPVGASTMVRYDPRNPSECVLEGARPSLAGPLIATAAGLFLALVGASLSVGS